MLNVLVGERFVLEITDDSMMFYPKTPDVKEIESFIAQRCFGSQNQMTHEETITYLEAMPKLISRFGMENVASAFEKESDLVIEDMCNNSNDITEEHKTMMKLAMTNFINQIRRFPKHGN